MNQSITKLVQEAVDLDDQGDFLKAFIKYIDALQALSQKLSLDISESWCDNFESKKIEMLLHLITKCAERAFESYKELCKERKIDRRCTTPSVEVFISKLPRTASDLSAETSSLEEEVKELSLSGPVSAQKLKNQELWDSFNRKARALASKGQPVSPEVSVRIAKMLQQNLFDAEIKEQSLLGEIYSKYQQTGQSDKRVTHLKELISKRAKLTSKQSKDFIDRLVNDVRVFKSKFVRVY